MTKKLLKQPTKRKDAEIIVKRSFGIGYGLFGRSHLELRPSITVIANRRGYRFLADHFRWLAERPISHAHADPGDHVHLTPHSDFCDEIDFTLNTLTRDNRKEVLRNARASTRSRRRGSPIRQFTRLVREILDTAQTFMKTDIALRKSTIDEINELITVLEEERSQLETM